MAVDLTPEADLQLRKLADVTHDSPSKLASDAVAHLYQALIGLPVEHPLAPALETGNFRKRYSYNPAQAVLRQADVTDFHLEEPLRYIDDAGGDRWVVPEGDTDLASVPFFLTWLVPRYGRHTFAALLHDYLQDPSVPGGIPAAEADRVFREAMADTHVPLLLRWLMWTAVSLRTRIKTKGVGRWLVGLWFVVWVALGAFGAPALVLLTVAGVTPVVTALLTVAGAGGGCRRSQLGLATRGYRFGLLSALGAIVVSFTAMLDLLVFGLYALCETGLRPFQKHPKPIRSSKLKPPTLSG